MINIYQKLDEYYGMFKVWYRRTEANVGIITKVMIVYLFLEKASWSWWYVPVLMLFGLFNYYDNTKGHRQENEYNARRNKILMDMHGKIMNKGE